MKFRADVVPVPQKRPRAAIVNGRVVMYDHPDCKKYKTAIAHLFKAQMGSSPLMLYPIVVYIEFIMPIPKSWTLKRKEGAAVGTVMPDTRRTGDIDNLIKPVLDAANGVIWEDDCQIVSIVAKKIYGKTPRVMLRVERHRELYWCR